MNTKKLFANMSLSAIYKPISIILSFVYVPIALAYLGDEKYGVWATILSVLSWISYFDIGIGNGMRNILSLALDDSNERKIKEIVSSSYIILGIIIVLLIIISAVFISVIDVNVFFNTKINDNIKNVLFISILFAAISFWMSLCKSIFFAMQKAHIVPLMGILSQALVLFSVLCLKQISNENLLYLALAYGLSNFVIEIIFSVFLFVKYSKFRISLKCFNKGYAFETIRLGGCFFVLQISALVLFTTDNLIITRLFGPEYVTYYSTVNKVFIGVASIISAFIKPLWSAMTLAKKKKKYDWIKNVIRCIHLMIIPISLCMLLLAYIFRPLSKIWLQKELNYPSGLIGLMAIYTVVYLWCQSYSMITNGLGMLKIAMIVSIIQGIINIPLSICCAQYLNMGINGVLIGTILSLMISAVVVPVYVRSYLIKNN